MKTSPVLADINLDGRIEVVVAYDDNSGSLNLRVYSPTLTCGLTGWSPGGGTQISYYGAGQIPILPSLGQAPPLDFHLWAQTNHPVAPRGLG